MQAAGPAANPDPLSPQRAEASEVLDARGLPPPQNVLAVLKRVSELHPGVKLEIRLDSNPFQLYDLLQQRGFLLAAMRKENGWFSGLVQPRDAQALKL